MTLCNGVGETFTGIGALGVRKRFRYGESFTVRRPIAFLCCGKRPGVIVFTCYRLQVQPLP